MERSIPYLRKEAKLYPGNVEATKALLVAHPSSALTHDRKESVGMANMWEVTQEEGLGGYKYLTS